MGIRPEHIHDEPKLLKEFPDGIVSCNVEVTELMGAETYLYVDCETHKLIARVSPDTTAKMGEEIRRAENHVFAQRFSRPVTRSKIAQNTKEEKTSRTSPEKSRIHGLLSTKLRA